MYQNKPIRRIGLFDSGIGGLTVLKELLKLPFVEYFYVADTLNVPYGQKTPEQIIQFSKDIGSFLISKEIDLLVIACHTSSAIAINHLRQTFPNLAIIGAIHETMQHAVTQTRNNRIGIMATQASINSHIHQKELLAINPELVVFEQSCPLLVPLCEAVDQDTSTIESILRDYLAPLMQFDIDTLILGCTHYPLLAASIQKIVGDNVLLISSEKIIAHTINHLVSPTTISKNVHFFSTANEQQVALKIEAIIGKPCIVQHIQIHNQQQTIVESQENLSNTV